jgi:hypothetical protein
MASSIKHNVRISQSVVYTIQKPRSHNAFFLIIKSDNHNILLKPTHTPTTKIDRRLALISAVQEYTDSSFILCYYTHTQIIHVHLDEMRLTTPNL